MNTSTPPMSNRRRAASRSMCRTRPPTRYSLAKPAIRTRRAPAFVVSSTSSPTFSPHRWASTVPTTASPANIRRVTSSGSPTARLTGTPSPCVSPWTRITTGWSATCAFTKRRLPSPQMPGIADFGAQFLRHLGRPAFARVAHHHSYKEVARVRLPQPGTHVVDIIGDRGPQAHAGADRQD